MKFIILLLTLFVACATTKYVLIKTDPPGAKISVNGRYLGRSSIGFKIHKYPAQYSTYTIEALPPSGADFVKHIEICKAAMKKQKESGQMVAARYLTDMTFNKDISPDLIGDILLFFREAVGDDLEEKGLRYIYTIPENLYSTTKFLSTDNIFGWSDDTFKVYFDLKLEPIPHKYELEIK